MLDLFQIGVDTNDDCKGLLPLIRIIRKGIFPIVQIGIPLILVILGTIESRLIKRCIYAVAIFFVVTLVTILMSIIADNANDADVETGDWKACWTAAGAS